MTSARPRARGISDGHSPSGTRPPLVLLADVPWPGGATRFDYQEVDSVQSHIEQAGVALIGRDTPTTAHRIAMGSCCAQPTFFALRCHSTMQRDDSHWRARVLVLWLTLTPLACRRTSTEEVLVFAAASTTDALQEIAKEYSRPGADIVTFSFGSSSTLAKQIIAGAPADIFLSADLAQMNLLEKAGLVHKEDRMDLLSNQLVVIVPARSEIPLTGPKDLANVPHVATADPDSVPVGVYARQWLESLGLWETIKPKIVPTLDVRAALAAVDSERAQAGIVYRTDAAISEKVKIAYLVPLERGPKIVYPVARLASSRKHAASDFVAFLGGPKAKAVFARYGFITF
jgi:molybdate transport system substrate-binding protein